MGPPNGPLRARSGSTWIHWWSSVASAKRFTRSCVISNGSLTPSSWPTRCFSSSIVRLLIEDRLSLRRPSRSRSRPADHRADLHLDLARRVGPGQDGAQLAVELVDGARVHALARHAAHRVLAVDEVVEALAERDPRGLAGADRSEEP